MVSYEAQMQHILRSNSISSAAEIVEITALGRQPGGSQSQAGQESYGLLL